MTSSHIDTTGTTVPIDQGNSLVVRIPSMKTSSMRNIPRPTQMVRPGTTTGITGSHTMPSAFDVIQKENARTGTNKDTVEVLEERMSMTARMSMHMAIPTTVPIPVSVPTTTTTAAPPSITRRKRTTTGAAQPSVSSTSKRRRPQPSTLTPTSTTSTTSSNLKNHQGYYMEF
jgi:hypothetical protein